MTDSNEVVATPRRRTFSAAYKAWIVAEAARCRNAGEIGQLLRREGMYSSHLAAWRKANLILEVQGRVSRLLEIDQGGGKNS